MVIVLSHPDKVRNEAFLINQLFDAGLQLFHLRKPTASATEVRTIIEQIEKKYHERVVLNQHYELAEEFGIHRFHFSTEKRLKGEHDKWKKEGNVLSTSTHSFEEYKSLDACFEYAFLSPVFDSISKQDYKKVEFDIKPSEKNETGLIALGGIKTINCNELKEKEFDGIGILGAIWQSETPVESFKKIKEVWNTHDQ